MFRRCTKCHQLKSRDEFSPSCHPKAIDGLRGDCDVCKEKYNYKHKQHEYALRWMERHHSEIVEARRRKYHGNPDLFRTRALKSYHKRRQEHPQEWYEARRWIRIKSFYGMTESQYNELLTKQNNVCAICFQKETKRKGQLHVDHDHDTGKIRGLLCGRCNTVLGQANENPALFRSMIDYLNNHKESEKLVA